MDNIISSAVHNHGNFKHLIHIGSHNKFIEMVKLSLHHLIHLINSQLNIYTELKNQYNFQNNMEDQFIYFTVTKNKEGSSMANFLIVFKQKENQTNYFNC